MINLLCIKIRIIGIENILLLLYDASTLSCFCLFPANEMLIDYSTKCDLLNCHCQNGTILFSFVENSHCVFHDIILLSLLTI